MVAANEQSDIEFTLAQACEYAGRKPRCVQYWVQRGLPVARESGRCTFFRRSDIDEFMRANGYRRFERGGDQHELDASHVAASVVTPTEVLEQGGVTIAAATQSQAGTVSPGSIDINRAIVGGRVQWAELVRPLMTQLIQLQAKMPVGIDGVDNHGATAKWAESVKKLLSQLQELEERASETETKILQEDAIALVATMAGEVVGLMQRAEENLINAVVRELGKHLPIDGVRGLVRTVVSEQVRELMTNVAGVCAQQGASDVG